MCEPCIKVIDIDNIKKQATKQRDFYQAVIDCEHDWEENLTYRLPHPFIDSILLAYQCTKCRYVAKITVTWEEYEKGIDIR